MRELSRYGSPLVATCRRQPDGTWCLLADHGFLGTSGTVIGVVEEEPEGGADADAR